MAKRAEAVTDSWDIDAGENRLNDKLNRLRNVNRAATQEVSEEPMKRPAPVVEQEPPKPEKKPAKPVAEKKASTARKKPAEEISQPNPNAGRRRYDVSGKGSFHTTVLLDKRVKAAMDSLAKQKSLSHRMIAHLALEQYLPKECFGNGILLKDIRDGIESGKSIEDITAMQDRMAKVTIPTPSDPDEDVVRTYVSILLSEEDNLALDYCVWEAGVTKKAMIEESLVRYLGTDEITRAEQRLALLEKFGKK